MNPEVSAATIVDEVDELAETSGDGSHAMKKNTGKIPKRVHKSEREKMKREQLNDLFLALANAVGLSQLNNGKASVLGETTRLLKEMRAQIDSLTKENASLLSESQYVIIEKNDLKDEASVLEAEVGKLRIELEERMRLSKPDLNAPTLEVSSSPFSLAPFVNPVYVIPVCPDLPAYAEHEATQLPMSTVSKPNPRYPTPSDSWPSQLLQKQPESSDQFRHSGSNDGNVAVEYNS